MSPRVFKPSGGRLYRGRFKLSNGQTFDVPLRTPYKHVAESALARLVREREEELAGILAPRAQREASSRPIHEHLADYVADLAGRGRSRKHVALARNRVTRLCEQCGWKQLGDISSDGFNLWRARQTMAPNTGNEYLTLAVAFLNWLERNQRIGFNPLRRVVKAETRGKERRKRRALTRVQADQLAASTGKRGLAYRLACYTGLRRGELQQLRWVDVNLDSSKPYLLVRASTTKNKKSANIPLLPAVAAALRERREASVEQGGKVFPQGVPSAWQLGRDLSALGIPIRDELDRVVDFHSLRYTFATILHAEGVAPRIVMELMRHSDARLSNGTYTDVNCLPLFSALERLETASPLASLNSEKSSRNPDQSCPRPANTAADFELNSTAESVAAESQSLVLSIAGDRGPKKGTGGEGGIPAHLRGALR